MPTARHAHKVVWHQNRIWVIGGHQAEAVIGNVESYDPSTNSWRTEPSLISNRRYHSAWVAHESILVAGGQISSGTGESSIQRFDILANSWISYGALPEAKVASDSAILNGSVYIIGGHDGSVSSAKVFAADLNASVEGVHDLYVKTGDASTGTPTVQAEVADGSIGPSKLSSEVSNALKPVVVGQPSSVVGVSGTSAYLAVGATGGDNTYQWKKNGADIVGATSHTLSITDLNASQHEGNYTVLVSNAFGSAMSSVAQIDANGSLTEGLVGWWKFDETDGNIAYDSSGNGNNGNLTNGPIWVTGKISGALSFDGSDDFVDLGNSSNLALTLNKSLSIWLKPTAFGSRRNPYNRSYGGTGALTIETDGLINYYYGTAGSDAAPYGYYKAQGGLSLNSWKHYCLVRNLSSMKVNLYLDGSLDKEITAIHSSAVASSNNAFIGKGYESNYHGIIDDVRIYDRALSAVEVKALYELGEQPVQETGAGTTTVVNGKVADGSITTNQLSEQILKYLKPEITQQPTAGTIFADSNGSISVSAEGKYLTYQWKKNGVNLAGENQCHPHHHRCQCHPARRQLFGSGKQ